MKPIHIYDEMFLKNFWVSYGVSREQMKQDFMAYSPDKKYKLDIEKANGKTICFEGVNYQIIWIWTEKKNLSVLSHEIFHAVYMALKGLPLTDNTDEVYAYMTGFLMRKILKKGG